LVPGSAREVPPWLIAGPVLNRLEALLAHLKRGFVERNEPLESPRGRIDWAQWARSDLGRGSWTRLPCTYPDLDNDPEILAAVRWTLGRLAEELASQSDSLPSRALHERILLLSLDVGPGVSRRPAAWHQAAGGWLADAIQAMGWVAERRGLGGARNLDGLAWDLQADRVWEAWVAAFVRDLAPQLGLTWLGQGDAHHRLNWHGNLRSMGALIPDTGLRGARRVVWVDAKYKAHLSLLARHGWRGLTEAVRAAHRADLHQALAYTALGNAEQCDTLLAYPLLGDDDRPLATVATLAAGRRRVRLLLAGLPFGFHSPAQRERALSDWKGMLMEKTGG
jgi:5-methylcytosine-specific restriction endonuclease McrBC regulatory subunit McrC